MSKKPRNGLSWLTRLVVVPLLLLGIGIRIGLYLGKDRRPPVVAPIAAAAPQAPEPAKAAAPSEPSGPPSVELAGSFQNNIYPSLLLSFGAAYPEYTRCITVSMRNLPAAGSLELRIDSSLLQRPLQMNFDAQSGAATLTPELPWNFDSLRRTTQMQPQTFVASVLVDGRPVSDANLVCTVHSVNEAVSRIYLTGTGQWQDTSVCFAAFVNEDHPWINALLQEAVASGGVQVFNGYQSGQAGAMQEVQAIWNTLAARGLTYVNVATDSGTSPLVTTQYVRFLDQSVRDQGANCVDASVLFCSILRRIGLRPVLLFKPGHCFAGFYDAPEGGHLVAFEPTFLGQAGFAASAIEGQKEMQATLPYVGTPQYSVVDIALCRQQGINPIPYEADRN